MLFDVTWQILAAAFILDVLAGDPGWLPHPIIWMVRAISFFEPAFRSGGFNDPGPAHIEKACELMMLSAFVSVILGCLLAWSFVFI